MIIIIIIRAVQVGTIWIDKWILKIWIRIWWCRGRCLPLSVWELFRNYFCKDKHFLLVDYLNPVTGCSSLDSSGRILEKILLESDLVIFNDQNITYKKFQSNYEEILDLSIESSFLSNKISDFKFLDDWSMGSDNLSFIFNLNYPFSSETAETKLPRFNMAQADWNSYHNFI